MPPTANSQKAFCRSGVSVRPPEVIVSITNVPESQPVMKKIRIRQIATNEVNCAQGKRFEKQEQLRIERRFGQFRRIARDDLRNAAIAENGQPQYTRARLARSMAPAINSRTVRPSEMRAMNRPTNGAQLIHHVQ